ncbi:hypothetical protein M5K25_012293 [Dendrobium thyrsiflorum]|uniref:Homeobox domain-containing protein n=1 Tax=Dendrobium thyrsiflorum TaxID=117978 RepID=A0ABD0UWU4_DENTH
MTVFYSSSTNQDEIMPSLYPREPARATYPEIPFQGNMMYFHHSSSAPCTVNAQDSSEEAANLVANRFGENMYDAWREGRNEMLLMQTVGGSTNDDSHLSILSGQNFPLSGSTMQGQGLSLSLGTQVSMPTFHYLPATADISFSVPNQPTSLSDGSCKKISMIKHVQVNSSHPSVPYLMSSTLNLNYLKATQELLDEVVNVRKVLIQKRGKNQNLGDSSGFTDCKEFDVGSKSNEVPSIPRDDAASSTKELSASEKQEFQNKLTKLMEMVDEVDRKYKQYYHQMQIVMSSFDVIAGAGAAKPYTTLALQTISRHFRCLRDAISAQIQSTRKKLGEQDNGDSVRLSRLRYIDQELRQRRVVQQYGILQPHAWRPQRGLPENSVSILRAWLFEHFLHPYPKDSEKLMLARQTGLTRSQVSNWFINARVRLWKPMIEEMHKEELGDIDIDSKSSPDRLQKIQEDMRYSIGKDEDPQSSDAENCRLSHSNEPSKSNPMIDPDTSGSGVHFDHKPRDEKLAGEESSLLQTDISNPDDGSGRIMAYQMAELGQYGTGMVSLTLGLQHWGSNLPVSNDQHSFISVRGADVYSSNSSPLEANVGSYVFENIGDRHHGCAGSLHFMQDFTP